MIIIKQDSFRHRTPNKPQMNAKKRGSESDPRFSVFICGLVLSDLHWERHATETVDALQPIVIKLLIDDSVVA